MLIGWSTPTHTISACRTAMAPAPEDRATSRIRSAFPIRRSAGSHPRPVRRIGKALSAWGVALAKAGVTSIETLPVFVSPTSTTRSSITYGNATNPQDLSNYEMFVVCEPNIAFTAAEKTAILNYVQSGGTLFMISDHTGSDRNSDGIDSVGVWNDFLGTTSVFGFKYNLAARRAFPFRWLSPGWCPVRLITIEPPLPAMV